MYRADHVGSFLRPREVLDARGDPAVAPERLAEIENRHILRILARQKDLGLEIFTDGELRRGGFMSDFYESVDGLDQDGSIARDWKSSGAAAGVATTGLAGVVVGRIRQKKRLTRHEADFLTRHSPGDIKMTLPSANQFPAIMYRKGLSDRASVTPTCAPILPISGTSSGGGSYRLLSATGWDAKLVLGSGAAVGEEVLPGRSRSRERDCSREATRSSRLCIRCP